MIMKFSGWLGTAYTFECMGIRERNPVTSGRRSWGACSGWYKWFKSSNASYFMKQKRPIQDPLLGV